MVSSVLQQIVVTIPFAELTVYHQYSSIYYNRASVALAVPASNILTKCGCMRVADHSGYITGTVTIH
jgi:hypothetical protein